MESQTIWEHKVSPLHVITALNGLAQLSQQTGALLSSALEASSFTSQLLQRVISLCSASQGALMLAFPSHHLDQRLLTTTSFSDMHLSPLIVRHHMSEEAMMVALAHYSAEGPALQGTTEIPRILLWRRTINVLPTEEAPDTPITNTKLAPYASTQALFLLYWDDQHDIPHLVKECEELLSLIAETVDAVIINLLLTLRVQDLEQLTYRQAEQQTELFKSELLATVSHELRGPLASIKGYTGTLLRHDARISRKERHEFLVAINSATARMETTVNRLLEISQLETKTIPFAPAPVNLERLVQESLIAARSLSEQAIASQASASITHPVTYTLCLEPQTADNHSDAFTVLGDRRLLRTLLDHLLENAALHSPPAGTIEIGLRALSEPSQLKALEEHLRQEKPTMAVPSSLYKGGGTPLVELWIRDHGNGIASEHLTRIFDRFYRVDMSLTREINGLGLGLAICKNIVNLHQGTIWVESEVGQGSTFHVLIPQETEIRTMKHIL